MNLEFLLHVYNDKKSQHKLVKILNKTILDVKRKFIFNGNILNYEIANHIEGKYIYKGAEANKLFSDIIKANKPAMIGRFGASELNIVQYFYQRKNKILQMHYPKYLIREAIIHPGIFSANDENLIRFSSEVLEYLRDIDILTVWNCFRSPEYYMTKAGVIKEYANPRVKITSVEPILYGMFDKSSWLKELKGKKVLVIHPFTDTIQKQYANRENLFINKNTLPDFDLKVIKAPQGIGKNNLSEEYGSWFNALESMQNQMDKIDFDICLIGAGAYGYHLAHYAKMIGKIGIHVAGALQLLFGIKGTRWMSTETNKQFLDSIVYENWVSPAPHEQPKDNAEFIKGEGDNAYW